MTDIGLLVLRLGLGIMFFAHGLQMALGKLGGPGIGGFSKMLAGMGFTPALFWSALAGYTTLLGGVCLILGILPRFVSFALLIFITVAAVKVHLPKGFFIQNGGYEYNFVIACGSAAVILLGAGKFSIFNKF